MLYYPATRCLVRLLPGARHGRILYVCIQIYIYIYIYIQILYTRSCDLVHHQILCTRYVSRASPDSASPDTAYQIIL